MRTVDGEILAALCPQCKCCLADSTHCYVDHSTKSIKSLCGCGECEDKAKAYNAWYELHVEAARLHREIMEKNKNS